MLRAPQGAPRSGRAAAIERFPSRPAAQGGLLHLGGAVGTVAGGRLAARLGRVPVVQWSYALNTLAVAGVVLVPGPLLCVCASRSPRPGCMCPSPSMSPSARTTCPRRVGTRGGDTLGLTVSIGGLACPLIAALADATTLRTARAPLIVLPALGRLLLRGLKEPEASAAATGRTRAAPRPRSPTAP